LALAAGTRLGSYEIISALGAGGMGEVYRATDTNLKRQVAIKVLPTSVAVDADSLARFQREAEVLAALNHPNIAHIHGLEKTDGTIALVMELVEGPTLADRIAQGPVALADALPIAKQIAQALEAAHEQGIIHRDLKPANIKVRDDGTVKVLDFGLAKASEPPGPVRANPTISPTISMYATKVGVILGTAAYMSPEQAAGNAVDKRSDLWAFGVVLLEMLTGRQVFQGETASQVLASVLKDEPDWTTLPTNTPASIRRLLRRCLEKDRRRRLADAADARLEIDEALTVPTADQPSAGALRPPRSAVPLVIASGLGSALLVALAMWGLMRPASNTPAPVMRFNEDLGPDAVGAWRTTVTLSPDGRQIVFPIRGADGTPQLATRLLDQAKPTPVPGTENGADPFFSLDGQWFGFAALGKLKKMPVHGGPVVTVSDAPIFRGGVWTEDGTIVASLDARAGLSRIPAAGGAPQPFTRLVNGEATHRWPHMLPGGQAVLFTASKTTGSYDEANLEAVTLNTGQVTTVLKGGYFGRYTSGYLTYLHQGVLWGVRFDTARLAVQGTPVPLLEDVASDQNYGSGQFDVSQTGTIVYRSGKTSSEWPIMWMEATGQTHPLLSKPGSYYTPRVSPDGRHLALAWETGTGWDIYAYDMQRDTMSRLTFNARGNRNPVWTPDGMHLVYASDADKAIWWIRADGAGEPHRLLENKNAVIPSSFSPDGRYLSYVDMTTDTGADIWILPLDASDPEHPKPGKPEIFLKTPSNEGLGGAAFSPDGRWIAYDSDESGRAEVYVRRFRSAVGGKWQLSTSSGSSAFWSRDGRALYYLTQDDRNITMVAEYTAKGDQFTPGTPRVWSDTPIRPMIRSLTPGLQSLDLAPDGRRFAVLLRDVATDQKGSVHVTFLLNLFDELRRRPR
jgi:serine/threonine protein kinase/WD40 repeat protein